MRRSWTGAVAGAAVTATVLCFPVPGEAEVLHAPASFAGAAEAMGVRGIWTVTPATLTDTPLDGGGPTAQVSVDSLGTSSGYAAFPDPGQAYVTIPGTVSGVLAGGNDPIPPVETPTLPNYPFFVSSNAGNTPEGQAGAGPYELDTASEPGRSTAVARTGFATGLVGNVAQITSSASLASEPGGAVLAQAVSHLEGLTVGPLAIGEIRSIARMRADGTGAAVPSTDFQMYGLRVGGFPVEVKPDGLDFGGANVPLPLSASASEALKPSGITVELVAPQKTDTSVLAPALQITMPYEAPTVEKQGGYKGAVRMIIGSAAASLTATAAAPADPASDGGTIVLSEEPAGVSSGPDPVMLPLPAMTAAVAAPMPTTPVLPAPSRLPGTKPLVGGGETEPPASEAALGPAAAVPGLAPGPSPEPQARLVSTLNTRGSYLMLIIGAAVVALVAPARRWLGVKP